MYILQERYIKINSINTRFYSEGEGSSVILIHGLGGSACGWLPSIAAVAAQHHVYALDLIGHGRTGQPDSGSLTVADMIRFIKSFMAEFKIDRAHVIGHSMGGAISLMLAIDSPERVNKLVLVDSGGLGKEIALTYRIMSLPFVGELLASHLSRVNLKKFANDLRASVQNAAYITDELIENLYRVEVNPEHAKMLLKASRVGVNWTGQKKSIYGPMLRQLAYIQNPTLVIWGRQDILVPLSHGELAAKTMPDARLVVIDQCNHVPMFEQPDLFNGLLLNFLKD